MATVADRLFPECDVLVMAAAVGDFRSTDSGLEKIRRKEGGVEIRLAANPDILSSLAAKRKSGQIVVGFALETENPEAGGREKLDRKGADLIVVNNPHDQGAAIGGDTNVVTLLERGKKSRRLPVLPKREVARRILDWVVERRAGSGRPSHDRSARGTGGA
jgi:phosphopantothenoylcysteine decarboxylase/phosphopantothenate--cysteine ligase